MTEQSTEHDIRHTRGAGYRNLLLAKVPAARSKMRLEVTATRSQGKPPPTECVPRPDPYRVAVVLDRHFSLLNHLSVCSPAASVSTLAASAPVVPRPRPPAIDRHFYSGVPLTPGWSVGRTQPLRRSGPHDALDVLYKAATDKTHDSLQLRPGSDNHARSDSKNNMTASRGRNATEFPADKPNMSFENHEARIAMRKKVSSSDEALDLLYKAATNKTYEGL